ncbi:MAG TPA: TraB/GumN family protein, partial [Erythrobacter sp.]|nr:TraB/GumN family protein [Erythrobacter sp.]
EVSDPDGQTEAWLFGTIHSLPDDVEWRTEKLDDIVSMADMLIVEIAKLDDQDEMAETFNSLAVTPGQPDISLRVPQEYRPALFDLIRRAGLRPADFRATETWAAALTLAQVGEKGKAANGADRTLVLEFPDHRIREFEGAGKQLGVFDQLPESEQRELLVEVILDVERRAADPGKTRYAWLTGDLEELERASSTGLLADPELRAALLVNRNLDWIAQLEPILEEDERPLVAVGAAHLVGPDGLPSMLEDRGYTITRLQ